MRFYARSFFTSTMTLACCLLMATAAYADTIVLTPSQDNTIYEDNTSNSNGAGDFIFAGNNGFSSPRRSLIQFDLSAIPTGAIINSATVTLNLNQTGSGPSDVSFHRLTSAWGESNSDATGGEGGGTAAENGDATWANTFFADQFWTNAGGDFISTASSTTNLESLGTHDWTGLAADVQGFLDGDFDNFGWILIGDELAAGSSSNRFNSSNSAANGPSLAIEFTTIPEPSSTCLLVAFSTMLFRRKR